MRGSNPARAAGLAAVLLALGAAPAFGFGTFGPPRSFDLGGPSGGYLTSSYMAFAVADFNGDGRRDLAAADFNLGEISVLRATGDGAGFAPAKRFPVGTNPSAIAVRDFNRDGDLDLAVANTFAEEVAVLTGGPGVNFAAPVKYPAGGTPRSVAAGDVNGDGRADLVVANDGSSGSAEGVGILPGLVGGSFGPVTLIPAGPGPGIAVLARMNRDRRLDLVVANDAPRILLMLGEPGGGFGAARSYRAGLAPLAIVITDVNGDRRRDVVASSYRGTGDPFKLAASRALASAINGPTVEILRGRAGGRLRRTIPRRVGPIDSLVRSLATADLDLDGDPDLVGTVGGGDQAHLAILFGRRGVRFSRIRKLGTGGEAPELVIARRLNRDRGPDLGYVHDVEDAILVRLNRP